MGFCNHVCLLLWKNIILQRRSVLMSITEVMVPIFIAFVMLQVRQSQRIWRKKVPTIYESEPVFVEPYSFYYMSTKEIEFGFTPVTSLTQRIMEDVKKHIQAVLPQWNADFKMLARIKGFATEKEMEQYHTEKWEINQHSIVFEGLGSGVDTLPNSVKYFVRTLTKDVNTKWFTRNTYITEQINEPRDLISEYTYYGTLMMQAVVAQALIREKSGNSNLTLGNVFTQRMPFPPYARDDILVIMLEVFSNFMLLSFVLPVAQCTKNVVFEKEQKLKESMKLMGVMSSAFWVSWFITCYIKLATSMAIFSFLFGYNSQDVGPVLVYSDISVFYVFLLCYAAAIVSFSFMISVFVQKVNTGTMASIFFFFVAYVPYMGIKKQFQEMPRSSKLGYCALFNTAMALGVNEIALYEIAGQGIRWSNVAIPVSLDGDFSLKDVMVMLLVDTAIHLLITWYMDNVWPGEFGIGKPYHFFLTRNYWCGAAEPEKIQTSATDGVQNVTNGVADNKYFEREPVGLTAGVQIRYLLKRFGSHVAVNNLSLNLYEGQITVLLGHNGAGKTTTMSMLTGFIPPTSGTAIMNGNDIRTDMDIVRKSLGLCPQHNILFDKLTVEEHLIFFAKLKGCPSNRVREEVNVTLREIDLEQKRHALSGTLSGGQKRKLSVGIALINGSKIVIFDEPSAGMDPAARRQLWDVLQKHRAGRTILLTTHFMDEADVLGDRIAIMAEGVIKCCGTPIFLKKLYGTGYHLIIVTTPNCMVSELTEVIQEALPGSMFESEINEELSYLLPGDQSALFPGLFRILEERKEELGIRSFGATATTIEEVFLKVGKSATIDDDEVAKRANMTEDIANTSVNNKVSHLGTPVDSSTNALDAVASPSKRSLNTSDENSDTSPVGGTNTTSAGPDRPSNGTTSTHLQSGATSVTVNKHERGSAVDPATSRNKLKNTDNQTNDVKIDILAFSRGYTKLSGCQLQYSRFRGIIVKKAIYFWRNRAITCVQVLFPVFFTAVGLSALNTQKSELIEKPLTFDLKAFSETTIPYSKGTRPDPTVDAMVAKYTSQFANSGHKPEYKDISVINWTMVDHFLKMAEEMSTFSFNKKVIIGAAFENSENNPNVMATAYFNGQPIHAQPISLAYVLNAVGRFYVGDDFTITSGFSPFPIVGSHRTNEGGTLII